MSTLWQKYSPSTWAVDSPEVLHMKESEIRKRLAEAKPAETPLCCLYLVAAVFADPPPPLTWSFSISSATPPPKAGK